LIGGAREELGPGRDRLQRRVAARVIEIAVRAHDPPDRRGVDPGLAQIRQQRALDGTVDAGVEEQRAIRTGEQVHCDETRWDRGDDAVQAWPDLHDVVSSVGDAGSAAGHGRHANRLSGVLADECLLA
jgi:hypothetical protein